LGFHSCCICVNPFQPLAVALAGRRILDDDGFMTGTFYVGNRPAYLPHTETDRTVAEIEQRFVV
jgi:hypothetical protein